MSLRTAARRHRALLATFAVASLGATGLITAPLGTASAQPGSRVCGYVWTLEGSGDVVARVAEINKSFGAETCRRATNSYDHLPNPTEIEQALGYPVVNGNWQRSDFTMLAGDFITGSFITCEDFQSILGHATDPCLEMDRSDTLFDMNQYLWGSRADGHGGFVVTVKAI